MMRIKALRLVREWTQPDLGKAARLPPSDISRMETGRLRPYPGQLRRLADALGVVDPERLFDEVELMVLPRAVETEHGAANGALVEEPGARVRG